MDVKNNGSETMLSDPNRLDALAKSGLLDTEAEAIFDRATRLATQVTGSPISLLSVVDDTRQFFKSNTGLGGDAGDARGTPLTHSLCQHVVTTGAPLDVRDAPNDVRDEIRTNGSVHDMGLVAYFGVPVHDENGHVLGSLCAIDTAPHNWSEEEKAALDDIAAMIEGELRLRHALNEKAMLLTELNHRIKNIFTITSSLVRMTARSADSVQDMAESLGTRLSALDAAQSLALKSALAFEAGNGPDDAVGLADLFSKITSPYNTAQIDLSGDAVSVSAKAATAFALIFHELSTNAMKYGALSDTTGRLAVSWAIKDETLHVDWREEAPITPNDTGTSGFGSQLIDMNLKYELGGEIERNFTDSGIHVVMSVPVDAITP